MTLKYIENVGHRDVHPMRHTSGVTHYAWSDPEPPNIAWNAGWRRVCAPTHLMRGNSGQHIGNALVTCLFCVVKL